MLLAWDLVSRRQGFPSESSSKTTRACRGEPNPETSSRLPNPSAVIKRATSLMQEHGMVIFAAADTDGKKGSSPDAEQEERSTLR